MYLKPEIYYLLVTDQCVKHNLFDFLSIVSNHHKKNYRESSLFMLKYTRYQIKGEQE